jgi:hypothetical protein
LSEAFKKECLPRKIIEVENLKNNSNEAFHPHLYFSHRSIKTNKDFFYSFTYAYMKKNIGTTDQMVRILIFIILVVVFFTKTVTGTRGIILLVVGIVSLITALTRFCGLYTLLGMTTCPIKKTK